MYTTITIHYESSKGKWEHAEEGDGVESPHRSIMGMGFFSEPAPLPPAPHSLSLQNLLLTPS